MRRTIAGALVIHLLFGLSGLPAQEPAPEGATFQIQSQLVQMYISISEGNRRIPELSASELVLTEDGKPKEIDRVDSANVPLQVALLLDTSGSMLETLGITQEAAVSFVEALEPADRVHFIPFNSDIRLVPQLTGDRTPIVSAIRQTQARGATKLYDALLFAMRHLGGLEGRKAIVLFSDGEDTARISSLETVLNAAARLGYPIYAIAARASLRSELLGRILRQLAEINRGRMFVVDEPRSLGKAFGAVAAELRSMLVVNYYTDVRHDGRWHDVSISPTNPRLKVQSRKGFFARTGANPGPPDGSATVKPRGLSLGGPAIQERDAQAAVKELLSSPHMDTALQVRPMTVPNRPSRTQGQAKEGTPLFRVETRFVEIPVLVEAPQGRDVPELSERDFRIYEDDQLREIAFFAKDVNARSLAEPRARAVRKLSEGKPEPVPVATDSPGLKLGRYYLVLDDMLCDSGAFLQIKKAAEAVVRQFQDPLRPISVHLLSELTADISPEVSPGKVLGKIRSASPKSSHNLQSNDNLLTVYQAFLIERGDRQAQQLVELRYASSIGAQFSNDLGAVDGQPGTPHEMIETMVLNLARQLVTENVGQVSRALDGLRAVVNAAAADPGDYPKDVILLSTGFLVGRASLRADMSSRLDAIIREARRLKTRVHAVDATGLDVDEPLGMRANGAFLVRNPHLMSVLSEHAHAWRMERQSPLSQMATETGGRFITSTNDLAAAAETMIGSRGRVYYLGFLSHEASDGRFHPIRVTVSSQSARVHSRKGYFAGRRPETEEAESAGTETREELLARALAAQAAGDMKAFAAALEPLAARFPSQPDLWHNLGIAYYKLGNYQRGAEVLQRAFALNPDERAVGLLLSRVLIAAGYRQAAAETLQIMALRQPHDVDLLMDLGRVFESDSRVDEAYQLYRQILDQTAAPPLQVYVLLARTSTRLGRSTEADIFIGDYLALGGSKAEIVNIR
jgi:VWFA-related protein